jgi:hypothetical protein
VHCAAAGRSFAETVQETLLLLWAWSRFKSIKSALPALCPISTLPSRSAISALSSLSVELLLRARSVWLFQMSSRRGRESRVTIFIKLK